MAGRSKPGNPKLAGGRSRSKDGKVRRKRSDAGKKRR